MKQRNASTDTALLEIKGSVLTIITIHIYEPDPDLLYPQLVSKISDSHSFFQGAPVLLDMSTIPERDQAVVDFRLLVATLRKFGLVPVAVRGCGDTDEVRATDAGLGLLPAIQTRRSAIRPKEVDTPPEPVPEPEPEAPQPEARSIVAGESKDIATTKVIKHPVRSGQQIIAPEGDLVILSSVNGGAEILAAGNIHVYGALRGRALAGINGDASARIFSLRCNPELVAIAGSYMVNESMDQSALHKSVVISLTENHLNFDVVGSFKPMA